MTELGDIFSAEAIHASLDAKSKRQALKGLAQWVGKTSDIDPDGLCAAISDRESLGSTAIGRGIAIPHVRMCGVSEIQCYFARLTQAVDFDSPDDEPVDLLFLILAPEDADSEHIRVVSKLARILRCDGAVDKLRNCRDLVGLQNIIRTKRTLQAGAA